MINSPFASSRSCIQDGRLLVLQVDIEGNHARVELFQAARSQDGDDPRLVVQVPCEDQLAVADFQFLCHPGKNLQAGAGSIVIIAVPVALGFPFLHESIQERTLFSPELCYPDA